MKLHSRPVYEPEHDPSAAARPEEAAAVLAGSPLFAGLPEDEVRQVVSRFDEQHFNSGHRITLEGLRGNDFYVVVDGRARVSVDGWRIGELGPGDFFGELGVLGDGLRFATVTAETPMTCVVLPHGELRQLLLDHPRMSVNVLGTVVERFHDLGGRRQPPSEGMHNG